MHIIKDKSSLGEILGYYCHNHHNFHDHRIDRYRCVIKEIITNTGIYGEMAQLSLVSLDEIKAHFQERINGMKKCQVVSLFMIFT